MRASQRLSPTRPVIELVDGLLALHGRIMPASNATFLGQIGGPDGIRVVYKPVAGERPLWDFPEGHLAGREVAAYIVSEALGWDVVPETWLRDGPHGVGMVQRWQEADQEQVAVALVPEGETPDDWLHVFDGIDQEDRAVSLIHENSEPLRRMAIFDVVVNNADRKGGHVLEMADGHRYGVDHGLTFHLEPKLRTVLWGWLGDPLSETEVSALRQLGAAVGAGLGDVLAEHLADLEIEALARRCLRLADRAVMPAPRGEYPAIPWPPF